MTKSVKSKLKTSSALQPIVIALIIVLAIVISLSYKYYLYDTDNFFESILIEAHGTVLDIFIFGILFTFINSTRNKKLEIQRFQEEIDDFRHWNELGASYRIAGILRRLDKYKIDYLDLSFCHLANAKLKKLYLKNAIFENANLENAELAYSDLQNATLRGANLQGADMRIANLQNADLRIANLQKANLRITNFKGANLFNVNFMGSDMKTTNLENCDLATANLEDTDLKSAILINAELTGANFRDADLIGAKLKGANFRGVNLTGAKFGESISFMNEEVQEQKVENEQSYAQLGEVISLLDAIMPDGTIYDKQWAIRVKSDFEKMKIASRKPGKE